MTIQGYLIKIIRAIKHFSRKYLNTKGEFFPYILPIAISLALAIAGLNGFVDLTQELWAERVGPYDSRISAYVQSFRSEGLTTFFTVITDMGDRYAYLAMLLGLGLWFFIRYKNWRLSRYIE